MMYSSPLYLSFMKKIVWSDERKNLSYVKQWKPGWPKQSMSDTGSFITQRFHVLHLGIFDWYYEDQEFLAASGQNYVMTIMWFSTIRSSLSLLTQELMVPNFLNYFLLVIINLCFCVSKKKKKKKEHKDEDKD